MSAPAHERVDEGEGILHRPVLLEQVLVGLDLRAGSVGIDATLGDGGHAEALLERLGEQGRLLGIDRDPEALVRAGKRLARFGGRFDWARGNFADVAALAAQHGFKRVESIIMDLGVSSRQLEDPQRGFSFLRDARLDMRMDPDETLTAEDIVNGWGRDDLADLFFRLGEEPAARRIANHIVRVRETSPIRTTVQLADLVCCAKGRRGGRIHPATRTFQALRMAVNSELESIEKGLEGALSLLGRGGRLAVISFHSLEDRLVKRCFREHVGRERSLQEGGSVWEGSFPRGRLVTRKPVCPGEMEIRENPRARSAKLRIFERTSDAE